MTVAVWVKVFDGMVLATDSATTLSTGGPSPEYQVYNNADKIFHLHRQLPIAAMTWGQGVVGPASISSLSKSFRLRLMGRSSHYPDWELNLGSYTIKEIAERASEMFAIAAADAGMTEYQGELGYLVCGISSDCDQAEAWLLRFQGDTLQPEPERVLSDGEYGFRAYAQPSAVNRLFNGYDDRLRAILMQAVGPENTTALEGILAQQHLDPVQPGMPIPDAISLARFMVETTAGYTRFRVGADTVGGPVEVASISPHEGFKWISRKHYFTTALNQGELQ
ncbi:hypothetical protein F1734_02130 [Rhodococcus ruber]|uniref:hypothetical protein n=1 Tax=Rhodococcus ruber TaxID=1830 RepID=UPI0019336B4A|nr:hypothetical protein [Rhodococcus ruber]QRE79174.1 hypothetical protein F1734_02130 [Rhodococcus ruber]